MSRTPLLIKCWLTAVSKKNNTPRCLHADKHRCHASGFEFLKSVENQREWELRTCRSQGLLVKRDSIGQMDFAWIVY